MDTACARWTLAWFTMVYAGNFFRNRTEKKIKINDVVAFPQDYAAAMTIFPQIQGFNKVVTVDIGGFTLDYLHLRNGSPELSVCDSLEKGVITLYNKISSRANSEYDILLDETDIDSIIKGEKTDYDADIVSLVQEMTKTYVDDLLGTLRELGLDLKTGCFHRRRCTFIKRVSGEVR